MLHLRAQMTRILYANKPDRLLLRFWNMRVSCSWWRGGTGLGCIKGSNSPSPKFRQNLRFLVSFTSASFTLLTKKTVCLSPSTLDWNNFFRQEWEWVLTVAVLKVSMNALGRRGTKHTHTQTNNNHGKCAKCPHILSHFLKSCSKDQMQPICPCLKQFFSQQWATLRKKATFPCYCEKIRARITLHSDSSCGGMLQNNIENFMGVLPGN